MTRGRSRSTPRWPGPRSARCGLAVPLGPDTLPRRRWRRPRRCSKRARCHRPRRLRHGLRQVRTGDRSDEAPRPAVQSRRVRRARRQIARAGDLLEEGIGLLEPGDERIPEAKAKLDALRKRAPMLTLTLPAELVPQASLQFDGAPLDTRKLGVATRFEPGAHEVVLTLPNQAEQRVTLTLREGEHRTVHLRSDSESEPLSGEGEPATRQCRSTPWATSWVRWGWPPWRSASSPARAESLPVLRDTAQTLANEGRQIAWVDDFLRQLSDRAEQLVKMIATEDASQPLEEFSHQLQDLVARAPPLRRIGSDHAQSDRTSSSGLRASYGSGPRADWRRTAVATPADPAGNRCRSGPIAGGRTAATCVGDSFVGSWSVSASRGGHQGSGALGRRISDADRADSRRTATTAHTSHGTGTTVTAAGRGSCPLPIALRPTETRICRCGVQPGDGRSGGKTGRRDADRGGSATGRPAADGRARNLEASERLRQQGKILEAMAELDEAQATLVHVSHLCEKVTEVADRLRKQQEENRQKLQAVRLRCEKLVAEMEDQRTMERTRDAYRGCLAAADAAERDVVARQGAADPNRCRHSANRRTATRRSDSITHGGSRCLCRGSAELRSGSQPTPDRR